MGTVPIQVKLETKKKMDEILERVNKKDLGRKIRNDELILMALSLTGGEQIKHLKENSLSNGDLFEQAYRRYVAKNKSATKDEFLGLVMAGKVAVLGEQVIFPDEQKKGTAVLFLIWILMCGSLDLPCRKE